MSGKYFLLLNYYACLACGLDLKHPTKFHVVKECSQPMALLVGDGTFRKVITGDMCLKMVLGHWSFLFHILPAVMFCPVTGPHTAQPSVHGPKPLKLWSKITPSLLSNLCSWVFCQNHRKLTICLWIFKKSRATEIPEHYSHRSEFTASWWVSLLCLLLMSPWPVPQTLFGLQFPLVKHADTKGTESNNACRVPGVISGT